MSSDIFEWEGKHYVVLVDYYSKFIEVDVLTDQRSRTVIETLKAQFCRHGIPAVLRMDNGPQYAAEEFKSFCESYGISHRTSSPHTPHSNGEASEQYKRSKDCGTKLTTNN